MLSRTYTYQLNHELMAYSHNPFVQTFFKKLQVPNTLKLVEQLAEKLKNFKANPKNSFYKTALVGLLTSFKQRLQDYPEQMHRQHFKKAVDAAIPVLDKLLDAINNYNENSLHEAETAFYKCLEVDALKKPLEAEDFVKRLQDDATRGCSFFGEDLSNLIENSEKPANALYDKLQKLFPEKYELFLKFYSQIVKDLCGPTLVDHLLDPECKTILIADKNPVIADFYTFNGEIYCRTKTNSGLMEQQSNNPVSRNAAIESVLKLTDKGWVVESFGTNDAFVFKLLMGIEPNSLDSGNLKACPKGMDYPDKKREDPLLNWSPLPFNYYLAKAKHKVFNPDHRSQSAFGWPSKGTGWDKFWAPFKFIANCFKAAGEGIPAFFSAAGECALDHGVHYLKHPEPESKEENLWGTLKRWFKTLGALGGVGLGGTTWAASEAAHFVTRSVFSPDMAVKESYAAGYSAARKQGWSENSSTAVGIAAGVTRFGVTVGAISAAAAYAAPAAGNWLASQGWVGAKITSWVSSAVNWINNLFGLGSATIPVLAPAAIGTAALAVAIPGIATAAADKNNRPKAPVPATSAPEPTPSPKLDAVSTATTVHSSASTPAIGTRLDSSESDEDLISPLPKPPVPKIKHDAPLPAVACLTKSKSGLFQPAQGPTQPIPIPGMVPQQPEEKTYIQPGSPK